MTEDFNFNSYSIASGICLGVAAIGGMLLTAVLIMSLYFI